MSITSFRVWLVHDILPGFIWHCRTKKRISFIGRHFRLKIRDIICLVIWYILMSLLEIASGTITETAQVMASSMFLNMPQLPFSLSWRVSLLEVLVAIGAIAFMMLMKHWHQHASQEGSLNLPPGPKPWPIVGNLLQLGPIPHKTVAELTKTYGPIVFLKLGSQPAVITSDPEIINEMMKVQDGVFSSRPQTICGKSLTYDLHDFIMAPYGDHWRAMRRICVLQLLSSKRLESFAPARQEESQLLVRAVRALSREHKEVDLRSRIESFAMNIITDMILGKKYFGTQAAGQEDNDQVMHLLMASFQFFGALNIGDFIPWLAPLDLQGYQRKMKKMHKQLDERMQAIIEEHQEVRKQQNIDGNGDHKRRRQSFVDVLLDLPGENGEQHLDDITVKALILNMMWSGLDVPVNISEWAMAELVRHPDIQQKLQHEIDDVVGRGRAVQETDIPNLPYLKCVVKEVFRLHPAGPFGVPRMNMVPAKVAGYDIPACTYVMISNTELGMSSNIWPHDAEQFRPERWEGKAAGALQQLQDPELRINPFGLGRRSCPGAALGSTLVLLCVATLVQSFHWGPGHGQKREDVDMRVAFTGLMPMQTSLKPLAIPRSPSLELD